MVNPNTIDLAAEISCDFQVMHFFNNLATAWPKVGDRENQPLFIVPTNFFKRTVWIVIVASGAAWFWQGRLVARQGGVKTFEMPLIFAGGGTATRHSLSVGYDQDNTGLVFEDKIQINAFAGSPVIPFSFIAAAQTISLEEDASGPGTGQTEMRFLCLSQAIW